MARPRTPTGPPPPPPVQKLRIRYARRGRLRFSSTRDFARALERALRRAQIPMAYSAGFHPHPKISYAGAAPTGTASEAEYFEISLAQVRDPDEVAHLLNDALPPGLDILEVVTASPGALADRLEASVWLMAFADTPVPTMRRAVDDFLACESVMVTRMVKSGPKPVDARAAVLSALVMPAQDAPDIVDGVVEQGGLSSCAILKLVVRHVTPAVRPDDVLSAMRSATGTTIPRPVRTTRLAQGPVLADQADVADPLAADRDTAGS